MTWNIMYKYSARLEVLFLSDHLSFFFSVSFQKLVYQAQFTDTFHGEQGRERVAFVLQDSHGRAVQILSIRNAGHARISTCLILKSYRQNFEEFGEQIFFLNERI